jgi:hypothetical protein
MAPVGDPEPIVPFDNGNVHSATAGTVQHLEGDATLTIGATVLVLPECHGDITDVRVFETAPHSFVGTVKGVSINCLWETPDSVASFFAVQDTFGFFTDAFLETPDRTVFSSGNGTGSLTSTALTASMPLIDEVTDDTYSAEATATFAAAGKPVTSTELGQTFRRKLTEQALVPVGRVVFSTGDAFDLDQEHCRTVSFTRQTIANIPSGPKPGGKPPVNDAPEGAIVAKAGSRFTVQTDGAALEAEAQVGQTCDEGIFDTMGRTVWYKVTGTGAPITFDTAGSTFDTVLGLFARDGDDFTELACVDDVLSDPVGSTYQAALTFDTVAGETYWVEVGGIQNFFDPSHPEFGVLKIKVS